MFKVQRSAQWLADHFETVPLYLFPFSQYDPTGGSIYPAVWNAMLAARAEGVGSCLTALLQFFHPTETFEILGVPTDQGWILSGTVSFGYPTGTWGVGAAPPGPRGHVPQHLGHRGRLRGARAPVAGLTELTVPFAGTVLRVAVAPGDRVAAGAVLLVIESMKMEHVVEAAAPGTVDTVAVSVGDAVQTGDVLLSIDADGDGTATTAHADARRRPSPSGRRRTPRTRGAARPRRRHARRGSSGGHRAPARGRAADGAGEHRGPLRPRQLRGVRRPRHRRPAGAPEHRRPHRQHAGRRPDRRHRPGQRRPLRQRTVALRGAVVRLLRPGRHPGPDEPPQEGPPLRARRAAAPPGRALRRGRRRTPRRHRHGRRHRARHRGLRAVRRAERQGAARRRRLGTLLRRQRRAPRMLPRHHRHSRRQHRDGWPGHDRGRRPGRVPPRGGRAGLGAGAERGRRCPLRRREGGRRGGPPLPVVLPGGRAGLDGAGPGRAAGRRAARPAAGLRRPAGDRARWPTRGRSSSCGRRSPRAW